MNSVPEDDTFLCLGRVLKSEIRVTKAQAKLNKMKYLLNGKRPLGGTVLNLEILGIQI